MAEAEPTRKELSAKLAETEDALEKERSDRAAVEARLARLETAFQQQASPTFSEIDLARLKAAKEELESLRPGAGRSLALPAGPTPKMQPYKGLVRAIEKCAYGHFHEPGEVFAVEVSALWTDDPYEPVREVGIDDSGPKYERRTDVAIIDFRFRRVISSAEDPTPRRAAAM